MPAIPVRLEIQPNTNFSKPYVIAKRLKDGWVSFPLRRSIYDIQTQDGPGGRVDYITSIDMKEYERKFPETLEGKISCSMERLEHYRRKGDERGLEKESEKLKSLKEEYLKHRINPVKEDVEINSKKKKRKSSECKLFPGLELGRWILINLDMSFDDVEYWVVKCKYCNEEKTYSRSSLLRFMIDADRLENSRCYNAKCPGNVGTQVESAEEVRDSEYNDIKQALAKLAGTESEVDKEQTMNKIYVVYNDERKEPLKDEEGRLFVYSSIEELKSVRRFNCFVSVKELSVDL
jgi:hypothetical protein